MHGTQHSMLPNSIYLFRIRSVYSMFHMRKRRCIGAISFSLRSHNLSNGEKVKTNEYVVPATKASRAQQHACRKRCVPTKLTVLHGETDCRAFRSTYYYVQKSNNKDAAMDGYYSI